MARFEMGSAWVSVRADSSQLKPEVARAASEASRSTKIKVDVQADEQKLDRLKRKAEDLGSAAARASLTQERAQLNVNAAQQRYDALLQDETASQDAKARALNRVQQAQVSLEQATRKALDVERERNRVARETDTIHQRVRVVVDTDVDKDVHDLGGRMALAFGGVGARIGKVLRSAVGDSLEAGIGAGIDAFRALTNAGVSTAAALGSALATGIATTAATGGINLLIGALLVLTITAAIAVTGFIALAPAVQLVAGAFGMSVVAGIGFVSVLGTLVAAFAGVFGALGDYSAMQDQVATGGNRMASQERSNAVAIRNAQESIADARRRSAQVAIDSAQRIADSQESLSRAQESAAERIRAAEDRVRDVNERAIEVQQRLNDEREEARQRIEDLADAARDAALGEEQAALRLAEAKQKLSVIESHLALADGAYTDLDRQRALLDMKEATFDLADAQEKNAETQLESNDAAAAGIEGDKRVVEAKKDAERATRDQGQAQADLAKAQRDGARDVAEAEKSLNRTRQDAVQAQDDANRAVSRAVRSLADLRVQQAESAQAMEQQNAAALKFKKSMDDLSPAGRAFVLQLIDMKKYVDALKLTAETATLPGVTQFLRDAVTLFPIVNGHVANMGRVFGGVFSDLGRYFAGDLFKSQLSNILHSIEVSTFNLGRAFLGLVPSLISIGEAASPLLEKFTGWLDKIVKSFGDWIEKKRESGELKEFFDGVGETMSKLSTTGELVLGIITDIIKILFPSSKVTSDTALDGFNAMLEKVKNFLEDPDLRKKIDDFNQKIKDFADWVKNELIPTIKGLFQDLQDFHNTLEEWKRKWEGFKTALSIIWSLMSGDLAGALSKMGIDWDGAWQRMRDAGSQWLETIRRNISTSLDNVRSNFSGMWTNVQNGWSGGWSWLHSNANTWADRVKGTVTGIRDHFANVFWSIPGALRGAANSIIGFFNDMIGKVNIILPNDIGYIPKFAEGGQVGGRTVPRAFATGGAITGPGGGTDDRVPILASNGEYIVRAAAVDRLGLSFMDVINQADRKGLNIGGDPSVARIGRFADGGLITRTQQWLKNNVDPMPYVFGAVGPGAYDCSGLAGEVYARLLGLPSFRRYFVTTSDFGRLGFRPGKGTYTIGVSDTHMAGNLAGMGFEAASSESGIHVGTSAQSVTRFPRQWYLPEAGGTFYGDNGSFLKDLARKTFDVLTGPLMSLVNRVTGPLGMPGQAVKGVAELTRDRLRDRVTNFDTGGPLFPGLTLSNNASGRTEQVLTGQDIDRLSSAADQPSAVYNFEPGSIVLDASKLRSIQDLIDLVANLKPTSRQFRGTRTVGATA